ncbi:transposase [Cenarchaeum symbiosum A]|uniref:Transposase n=1 Tax=Cenarchaeum symbiosum (strain A) TaxID=414004 RepID=A0RUH5_CENSY|nr:transposase [Cenarchaeum symbiosum A]
MTSDITLLRRELLRAAEREKGYEATIQENGRRTAKLEAAVAGLTADLATSRESSRDADRRLQEADEKFQKIEKRNQELEEEIRRLKGKPAGGASKPKACPPGDPCDVEDQELLRRLEKGRYRDGRRAAGLVQRLRGCIAILTAENKESSTRNAKLERFKRQRAGPHMPSSAEQFKGNTQSDDRKKPGRGPGHIGKSSTVKCNETERHRCNKCKSCGGRHLKHKGQSCSKETDVEVITKVKTINHITETHECMDCGVLNTPKTPIIPGTSFGVSILAILFNLWQKGTTIDGMTDHIREEYGLEYCGATVQNAMAALGKFLEPLQQEIIRAIQDTGWCNGDETGYRKNGEDIWAWLFCNNRFTLVLMDKGRSMQIPALLFPRGVRIICDGLGSYKIFPTMQRCWAHILRDAKDAAQDAASQELHRRLQQVFADAKAARKAEVCGIEAEFVVQELSARTRGLAKAYMDICPAFGKKLANAEPNLFTFLYYHDMPPTNNAAERAIKAIIRQRRCREQLKTAGGMMMFGVLMTCLLTWKQQEISIRDGILAQIQA